MTVVPLGLGLLVWLGSVVFFIPLGVIWSIWKKQMGSGRVGQRYVGFIFVFICGCEYLN